jgi:hypothetical protein
MGMGGSNGIREGNLKNDFYQHISSAQKAA